MGYVQGPAAKDSLGSHGQKQAPGAGAHDDRKDAALSYTELRRNLDKVDVHAERILQRLRLEADMAEMLLKLPNFCICVACFLVALCEFVPPASVHNVHRHIEHEFGLQDVGNITDFDSLYEYMEHFEKRNEHLQATSAKYWCEERYSEHRWDDHLLAPVWECPSPRQYALSLIADERFSWSALNASSGSRRLAGASSSATALRPVPECKDDDEALRQEEANPNVTCANFASHVCDTDLGILLCPRTCNYCSPFRYDHLKRFAKPQVTMLPVVVYQTRFRTDACHGFAATYEMQPFNPVLTLLPALDGLRHGRILTCIDRSKQWDGDYAIEVECPAHGPTTHCHNGTAKFTQRHTFHHMPIYPQVLIEPHRDILAMKAVEWLDLQTDTVALSTMVYTEGSEIFTSVTVEFRVDGAGNVDGAHHLISYRDLTAGSRRTFIACLVACAVGAFVGVVLSAVHMIRFPKHCKWGYQLYEFFSRGILLVYPLVLLISWSYQVPMAREYHHLLYSFLEMHSLEREELEEAVQTYFDAKTHLYEETNWLMRHRVAAYLACYVQFLQLVFYFSCHPKMGVLTLTVFKAMSNILHFLIIFATLFLMLAFMAHWMLGGHVSEFGTYGETVKSQARMMFGEFIESEDAANKFSGVMMAMYWLYAVTFMLVVWMTLLNFFLAIVVDAFVDVKEDQKGNVVAKGFISDFFSTIQTQVLAMRSKWPARSDLIAFFDDVVEHHRDVNDLPQWLQELDHEDQEINKTGQTDMLPRCTAEHLTAAFPNFDDSKVTRFLLHYFAKNDDTLLARVGEHGIHDL